MLVIHGGPGQSEAHFAYLLEEDSRALTTVYYDQRGAGKTLLKNPTKGDDVTFDQLFYWQVPIELIKEYYEKISAPAKGFYTVENASHITFLENPQGTVAALAAAVSQITNRING
jgi:pimeloyl-ACP methyl ester carboxylesterase